MTATDLLVIGIVFGMFGCLIASLCAYAYGQLVFEVHGERLKRTASILLALAAGLAGAVAEAKAAVECGPMVAIPGLLLIPLAISVSGLLLQIVLTAGLLLLTIAGGCNFSSFRHMFSVMLAIGMFACMWALFSLLGGLGFWMAWLRDPPRCPSSICKCGDKVCEFTVNEESLGSRIRQPADPQRSAGSPSE